MCEFKNVDAKMVEEMLLHLSDETSHGIYNVDGILLKVVAKELCVPICHIFYRCLTNSSCPALWKEAKVIPLPKNKKATFSGANSRPISLLPVLSKILERIVFNQIQDYVINNELITKSQHAYRVGHSTNSAIVHMTDEWFKEIDNKIMVGTVMLHFSAAFYIIDHALLIAKLKCYGFADTTLSWMESYLSGRRQRVFFNGSLSVSKDVLCGVPQGICLGPLLFSIFTNDLPYVLEQRKVVMYVDESTLFCAASTCKELTDVLCKELQTVSDWVEENKLVLNITKTKCMVIGTRRKIARDSCLNLSMGGIPIEQVRNIKLLGIIIDDQLSWSDHIGQSN